jgi:hypothetical protein
MSLHQQRELSLFLIIAVVREEKSNNKRIFYLCKNKRFLPADVERAAESVNPIRLNLQSLPIEPDGTFKYANLFNLNVKLKTIDFFRLSLRLMNKSSQSTTEQNNNRIFYQLDEKQATNLHSAPYNPKFFRLACILVKEDVIDWNTLCLSDYIRPSKIIEIKN